jgi:hypothetical protein
MDTRVRLHTRANVENLDQWPNLKVKYSINDQPYHPPYPVTGLALKCTEKACGESSYKISRFGIMIDVGTVM